MKASELPQNSVKDRKMSNDYKSALKSASHRTVSSGLSRILGVEQPLKAS